MPPKVICGPFQPALEEAFVARIAELKPGFGRAAAVVTPSRRMADRLQRLVVEKGVSLLNVRFHTFYSLASEIVDEGGGTAAGDAPSGPGSRLARRSAALGRDDVVVVGDALFHDKLVDRILRERRVRGLTRGHGAAYRSTIKDLIDAGVEPGVGAIEDLELNVSDRRRLEELLEILAEYKAEMAKLGIMPASGLAARAREIVEAGEAETLAGYGELLYYGFYDLTGIQAEFFSAVAGRHPVTVFFPYVEKHPAYEFCRMFVEDRLLDFGAEPQHLKPEPANLVRAEVQAFNVSGTRDELWRTAKEIRALHDGPEKVPFGEMGIMARSLEPYRPFLDEVLTGHGIPFYQERGGPLLRHPAARLSLLLLTLDKRDYPWRTVLDILESPYFRLGVLAGDGPGNLDSRFRGNDGKERCLANWRRLVERTGVHSGWLQWAGKLEPHIEKDFELYPHRVEEGDRGYAIPAADTRKLWSWLKGLRDWTAAIYRVRSWSGMAEACLGLLADNFTLKEDDPGFAAYDKVRREIAELAAFDQVAPEPTWVDFLEMLEERLRRASMPGEPATPGVRVLSAMEARGESFGTLFLIGLTEGMFPRQAREDPLLSDAARIAIREGMGNWLHGKEGEGYDEERLLFWLSVGSARDRLYCAYTRSDDKGKPKIPSPYLRDLAASLGKEPDQLLMDRVARPHLAKLGKLDPRQLTPREALVMLSGDEADSGGLFKLLELDKALFRDAMAELFRMRVWGEPGEFDGVLHGAPGWMDGLSRRGLSPTAIDSFARCPYQFFAERVLRLPSSEEPSERGELSRMEKGNLYHAILARFYADLKESGFWMKGGKGKWLPRLQKSIEAEFAARGWKAMGVYPVLWEAAKALMTTYLERFAAEDIPAILESGLYPGLFEEAGQASVGALTLKGRMDRVDLSEDGQAARIVDYKSGFSQSRDPKGMLKLKITQPAVYAELALAASWGPRDEHGIKASGYANIEDAEELSGKDRLQELDGAFWLVNRNGFLAAVGALKEQMSRGEFFIAPDDGEHGHCQWCSYARLCRKSHPATRRRSERCRLRRGFDSAHEVGGGKA